MRSWLAVGLAIAASGCWGGDDETVLEASALSAVPATDGQSAVAGSRLPQPLAVQATTRDARAVPRAAVRWRVAGGGGTLADSVTLSDGTGRALVDFVLGPSPGPQLVQASLVSDPERFVSFTVTAVAAPTVTGLAPATFTSGDVVTLQGSGLDLGGLVVEVGSVTARVSGAGPTTLTFIAPPCLAPGPVAVRVRVGTTGSSAVNGQYVAAAGPLFLAVGELASIEPGQLAGCATFPAAGTTTVEYLVAPQATTGTPGLSTSYRLAGDSVVVVIAPEQPAGEALSWAERFHYFLRQREGELARAPRPPVSEVSPARAPSAEIMVGDRREFRVCDKVTCSQLADFPLVTAEARYVGEHAAIYQDVTAPANGFVAADFDSLGAIFDRELYDVDTRAFGIESDVDGNGLVLILITPTVNRLSPVPQCQSSIITGFFFSYDIDPSAAQDQRSNQAEVFYTLAPDPQAAAACGVSVSYVKQQIPVTFVHEFQHMISYNQHVLLRGGTPEKLWLNEAMSHLAEELGGLRFRDLGQPQVFSTYLVGDLLNAYRFLRTPGAFYALPSEGTASLEERGGAWLFLRWLVDQFGPGITRRLSETSLTGEANVVNAVGEPIGPLLSRWFVTNYVSDLTTFGFVAPPRLRYTSWAFRTTYQSLSLQSPARFPVPFPITPPVLFSGAFDVNGTLRSGSGDYFRVRQGAGQRGFTIRFTDRSGGPLPELVAPRLNVVRVR